jgi:hypothetical protein
MQWIGWVRAEKLSWAEAGRRIGVTTSEARQFGISRIPRKRTMRRIYLATGGQVTPNDFYDLPELPADVGEAA